MNENMNNVYEYYYLDNNISKMREEVLKNYLNDHQQDGNMQFMDLDFYIKDESYAGKIKSIIYQSVFDKKIILSESQIEILNILENNNLFLSAPTSFGKTFIVLEYMKRHQELNNIVFIVPTLALMNELLKKIYDSFGDNYNICINGNEKIIDKNIFIFVPERSDYNFVKLIIDRGLDLLVFDEIYKLRPKDTKELKRDDRIILMNKVYLELVSVAKKIILLGPFIKKITFENTKMDIVRYYTNLSPVYNHVQMCSNDNWLNYIGDDNELVYFNSPRSICNYSEDVINKIEEKKECIEKYRDEIMHLENTFFKEWYVIKLLKRGIGVHHGKIPMFLRKFFESEFRNGGIKCLLCTSTLMEGINTPAIKILVVEDPGNIFRLNNLIGRVGRLNVKNPTIGQIYLFNEKSCNSFKDRNKWESLTILAEDPIVKTEDEALFLDKKIVEQDKKRKYEDKLKTIQKASEKNIDEIKKYDIRINIAEKFVENNYIEKFMNVESVIDCINLSFDLFDKISYIFNKKHFENINYKYNTLPYRVFTNKIIDGNDYGRIISDFEKKYGKLSIKNINILVDKLFELRTYIRFKLSKIINYFELFNVDIGSNRNLNQFVNKIKKYCELNLSDKIMEDLGIEESDFKKLNEIIGSSDKISTSEIVKCFKYNKERIRKLNISPFTKRNIDNF